MPGSIPRHFIDTLLQRIDIVDIIDARIGLKKAGRDFQARCPFHDEKSPSFTVSQVKQFYHCFGCGANGSAIGFLMEYDHLSFPESVEELAKLAGIEIPYEEGHGPSKKQSGDSDALIELLGNASRFYRTQLRTHANAQLAVKYLKKRGLSGEIASRFELGFAPAGWDNLIRSFNASGERLNQLEKAGLVIKRDDGKVYDRFRERIMFPIRDHRGRMIGFGGRIIDAGEPKYLNSPETPVFHKGSELYGLHGAQGEIKSLGYSIAVEGYMDVVALAQHGIDNAVATLGTATTSQHLNRLFRASPHVVFCFDGDRAGRDAARKAMETSMPEMRDGRQVSFLFLPDGEDPDDYVRTRGKDSFLEAVTEAQPLEDFLFQHLLSQTNSQRSDGRARMIDLARPYIGNAAPGAFKELLLQRLGQESGFDDNEYLERLLQQKPNNNNQPKDNVEKQQFTPSNTLQHLVSLLLQNPGLIKNLENIEGLETANPSGDKLLKEIKSVAEQGNATTALLVEHFRGTGYHKTLEKLATWNHLLEAELLGETLEQMIVSVQREILESAIDKLLDKATSGNLEEQEKHLLAKFTRSKQNLRFDARKD
ncbi:MAG: DNA primase [Parasphingorhabdus sp.]|jgi:DNA primase